MYTGSGPRITTIRLPPSWRSPTVRTDTGTSARISMPSVRTPRAIKNERSAPVTTASTTSLTVPPNAFLTSLKSSSCAAIPTKRRCGPISTFSGVSGAGFSPAHTISPTPSAASRARSSVRSGWVSASIAPLTISTPARTAPRTPDRDKLGRVRLGLRFPRSARMAQRLPARVRCRTAPSRDPRPRSRRSANGGSWRSARTVGGTVPRRGTSISDLGPRSTTSPTVASSGRVPGRRCAPSGCATVPSCPGRAAPCGARGTRG